MSEEQTRPGFAGAVDLPSTEAGNPASIGIDARDARGILEVIHAEDRRAWDAVGEALPALAALVDAVEAAFRGGGRLLYAGAGTSGRLGVLDAAECPPTFGVPRDLVQGVIAGGDAALRRAIEGAEDSAEDGARAIAAAGIRQGDVVCGIAASGTTPFVWGALAGAREKRAVTALIHCNSRLGQSRSLDLVDHPVLLDVGPEVIAGSTRLKGGTATKMALNLLTTAAMIRWGKVHDNLMVDLVATNHKLRRRAIRLIRTLTGAGEARAAELFGLSGGSVKVAVVMERARCDAAAARQVLDRAGGRLRGALEPGVQGG